MKWMYTVPESVDTDEPIMLINTHIGFTKDDGQGIDGALFQKELLALDNMGKKAIQIWINSPGGVVADAYNIYSAIQDSKTKVDTYGCGAVASSALWIFQAGRNRVMNDYAFQMMHNAKGGSPSDMRVLDASIATMLSAKSGKTEEQVSEMMNRTTWLSPEEAKDLGFCDEIRYSSDKNKKHGNSKSINALWSSSNLILNSILKPKNKKMDKVNDKLGLNPEANDDSKVAAITAIENKMDSFRKGYNDMKADYDEMCNKCANLQKQIDEMMQEKEEAKNEMMKEKAKNMVQPYVDRGTIKDETVPKWINMAIIDFDGTKSILEEIPLNKVSAKIITQAENKIDIDSMPISTAVLLAKNRLARQGKN